MPTEIPTVQNIHKAHLALFESVVAEARSKLPPATKATVTPTPKSNQKLPKPPKLDPNLTPVENERIAAGYKKRYGVWWPPTNGVPMHDLTLELEAFRNPPTTPQSPGRPTHFKNIVQMIWNHPNSTKKFIFHPWAERMLENACQHKFLAIAGCSSSGKSEFGALWGIVSFLSAPNLTKILVTSTSLKDSRQRIWGSIEEYWQQAASTLGGEENLPGELVSASGLIRYRRNGKKSDRQGLVLIAGEKSKANEAMGKLIGYKGEKLILVCDELPELSEKLLQAAEANLFSNPDFSMIGIGNPNSHYDPFGVFCTPKAGWASITQQTDEWETERGYCIRFDGEQSPNILLNENRYPWMITKEKLADFRRMLGETTLRYARFVKGWFHETGGSEGVFSEADIIKYKGAMKTIWATPPIMVAGFDPAFTNGGDDSMLHFGRLGSDDNGLKILEWGECVELNEDRDLKDQPRTHQVVRMLRKECEKRGVSPRHLAIDGTGAGKPFCDVVRSEWSGEFLEVSFGGSASDLPASGTDSTPSKERYTNRVSEIWYSGREYLQSGQIRGIYPALAVELCARQYETRGRGKVCVESKKDMKDRIGKSPDRADSALLVLALCRARLGMASKLRTKPTEHQNGPRRVSPYKMFARRLSGMRR